MSQEFGRLAKMAFAYSRFRRLVYGIENYHKELSRLHHPVLALSIVWRLVRIVLEFEGHQCIAKSKRV